MIRILTLLILGIVLIIGVLLFPTAATSGYPPVTYNRYNDNYRNEVLVPVGIPVIVPAYSFRYDPTPSAAFAQTPAQAPVDIKKIVKDVIKELQTEVDNSGPPVAINPLEIDEPVVNAGSNDLNSKALNVLANNCASCHTGSTARAGVKIFLKPNVLNPEINKTELWDVADSGQMPPVAKRDKSKKLVSADLNILREWMRIR
jgi:mono/diheme cytochrome c family protein